MNQMLALHIIAFAMGTGMSFSNLVNFALARRLPPEQARVLAALRGLMGRIGDAVIALIWLTGLALAARMTGDAGMAAFPVSFHVKMLFVLLLTASHVGARLSALQAARGGGPRWVGLARLFTAGVFLSAVASILLALAAFH
ncbi:MAG TPA: hypothetical protein ENK13_02235 [Thermopetrobacter sp.]|nr:hypothetical protein [Thermopetrobacter sp.]